MAGKAHAGQRHHGELQAIADLHGHHFDGVAGGVKVAGAAAHFYGHLALVQHLGAQVARAVVGAQNSHVAPGVAFFVRLVQLVGNRKRFFAQRGQFDDDGRLPFAPAADGFDQRYAVVVFVVRSQ